MNKLTILFITHYSDMYGANKSLITLIKILKDQYNVYPIVLIPEKGNIISELDNLNIQYLKTRFYPFEYHGSRLKSMIKYIYNLLSLPYICFKLKKFKFDFIHSNSSIIDIGSYLSILLHIPHVWHLREFGKEDYNFNYIFSKKITSLIYKYGGTKFIAISKSIFLYFKEYIPENKIVTIYNGVDIKTHNNNSIKNNNIIQLCCIGLISQNKNQNQILEAANILKNEIFINNFNINFIGNYIDETYYNHLLEYAKSNDLIDNLKFWGYQNEISQIIKNMDIGIVPSKKEAFGRVTIEFMLNKIPVIVSNQGANTELIENNSNGLVYDINDSNSLAQNINLLINDKKLRESYGMKGYITAEKNYTAENNAKKIYDLYNSITI